MFRNKYLAIFLAVFIVLAVMNNIRYFSKRKKRAIRTGQAAVTQTDSKPRVAALPQLPETPPRTETTETTTKTPRKARGDTWGRNPFLTPAEEFMLARGIRSKAEMEAEKESPKMPLTTATVLRLEAIIISDSRKIAIINNKPVTEGDLVEGERVVRILPNEVVLQKGNIQRRVAVQTPSIPLIIQK